MSAGGRRDATRGRKSLGEAPSGGRRRTPLPSSVGRGGTLPAFFGGLGRTLPPFFRGRRGPSPPFSVWVAEALSSLLLVGRGKDLLPSLRGSRRNSPLASEVGRRKILLILFRGSRNRSSSLLRGVAGGPSSLPPEGHCRFRSVRSSASGPASAGVAPSPMSLRSASPRPQAAKLALRVIPEGLCDLASFGASQISLRSARHRHTAQSPTQMTRQWSQCFHHVLFVSGILDEFFFSLV